MVSFRSLSALRYAAFFAVLSSVQLAHAEYYWWVGQTPDADYGLDTNWQYGLGGSNIAPGDTDDIVISGSFGYSPAHLDHDRTHHSLTVGVGELDLSGHQLDITYGTELQGSAVISNGTLNSWYVNVWNGPGYESAFNNVQFNGSLNIYDSSILNVTNSMLTGSVGAYRGGTLNLTNTSIVSDYGLFSNSKIDATSTINLGAGLTPDIYNAALVTNTGSITLDGSLVSVGSKMGYDDQIDKDYDPSTTDPRTDSSMRITSTGSWTDTTETVNSLGFGGKFFLSVDGGTVNFANHVNLGEGTYDRVTNEGMDGEGLLIVENGGSFTAQSANLGGWSRWGFSGEPNQVASGSGNVIVRNDGVLNLNSVYAYDQSKLNRGSSSLFVESGGTANVGYLLGGSNFTATTGQDFTLAVQAGGKYVGDGIELYGAPGKTVQGNFFGSNTTVDVQRIIAGNGARVWSNGTGSLATSSLQVGANTTPMAPGFIKIENGPLHFESKTGTYNSVWAVSGTIDLLNTTMTVAPGQQVSFQAGAYSNSGSGTLNIVNSSFDGEGGLFAGVYDNDGSGAYGYANVVGSNLTFQNNGAVGIGDSGRGSATFDNSHVDAWRVRVGNFTGGNGDVAVYNSSITAHADSFTTSAPGGIIIGNAGSGKLEMFNSSLNAQKIYIGKNGLLKGDGTLNGDPLTGYGTTVENHGTISPGHSPGKLTVNGDLVLTSTSVLEMEIDLSDPTKYDQIFTTGNAILGGTFRLKAIGTGPFDPTALHFTFLTATSFSGSFSQFDIDPIFGINGSAFSFKDGMFGINPQAVPEPTSLVAIGVGVAAFARRRRHAA